MQYQVFLQDHFLGLNCVDGQEADLTFLFSEHSCWQEFLWIIPNDKKCSARTGILQNFLKKSLCLSNSCAPRKVQTVGYILELCEDCLNKEKNMQLSHFRYKPQIVSYKVWPCQCLFKTFSEKLNWTPFNWVSTLKGMPFWWIFILIEIGVLLVSELVTN